MVCLTAWPFYIHSSDAFLLGQPSLRAAFSAADFVTLSLNRSGILPLHAYVLAWAATGSLFLHDIQTLGKNVGDV